ncbi:MAG: phosphate acyltransferase [delta proteobacterium ML8_F1]|nr:MAG: phosphate acyltransferase [delta proteobacterium ML8_F1]
MIIALDVMGGDKGPREMIRGALAALERVPSQVMLIGTQETIEGVLEEFKESSPRLSFTYTTEVIENDDKPVQAIKRKKDSSMVVGFDLLKKGEIDAFISAGNTGALLAGGLLRLGRIRGIDRPSLATVYPMKGKMGILTDAGANAEVKPQNYLEFATMASIYASRVLGISSPKVGLVNIGTEKTKGTPQLLATYELLEKSNLNFIGNIEGRDIPLGVADIALADGFTGNVILKVTEGVATSITDHLKSMFMKNTGTRVAALLVKSGLAAFKKTMDYTEYGGAPLLGLKGAVVKAHGSSNHKAIMNAIVYAQKYLDSGVIDEIETYVKDRSEAVDEA